MKILKRIMIAILSIVFVLFLVVWVFIQQAKFGKLASGDRLARIEKSPNFKNGEFHNLNPTPMLADGVSYFSVTRDFFFSEKKRNKPVDTIPSIKTDLLKLDPAQDVLVWFGHSSYFIQLDGKKILVDPVFSGAASPLAFTTRSFTGTDVFTVNDFPDIDYLFISHDHWDHVDHETLLQLKSKVGKVICGLGVGAHFEHWGYDPGKIIEKDWNEEIILEDGFKAHAVPARHFSGRGFTRNKSLWASYVLQSPSQQIYIGGDSGYDTHFAEIGKKFGVFDLVILENGQYNMAWHYIHMMPNEVLQAAKDLNAKRLFPVHSSKFALSLHAWDDPLTQITEFNKKENVPLVTPIIGEVVNLRDSAQQFSQWWVGIK